MAGIKSVFAFAIAGAVATVLVAFLIPPARLPAHEEKVIDRGILDQAHSLRGESE